MVVPEVNKRTLRVAFSELDRAPLLLMQFAHSKSTNVSIRPFITEAICAYRSSSGMAEACTCRR
jgi:hypothetical protein